jgi:hypothetical protein
VYHNTAVPPHVEWSAAGDRRPYGVCTSLVRELWVVALPFSRDTGLPDSPVIPAAAVWRQVKEKVRR